MTPREIVAGVESIRFSLQGPPRSVAARESLARRGASLFLAAREAADVSREAVQAIADLEVALQLIASPGSLRTLDSATVEARAAAGRAALALVRG